MDQQGHAAFVPSSTMLSLIGNCVLRLTDVVVVTEAEPCGLPGPRIVFVNDAFELQTGYTRDEVIGKTPRVLQGPLTDQAELRRISAALRAWQPVRAKLVNYTKRGQAFHVEMDIVPIADETGWFTHWVAIQRDVTQRKLAEGEAATRDLQRTESIGTLAIGIAHDFNNIIAAILGNVVLGRQDLHDGQSALRALDQIDHAATRARGLVQQILAYARRQPPAFRRQPLAPLIKGSIDMLRAALPSGVSVTAVLDAGAFEVFADGGQLNQVLLNLGTNAWHAMGGNSGRIDIRLSAAAPLVDATSAAVTHALLEVQDNGAGMEAATLAHLFDPYFTTKPIGQGTGLGLSVVWGIVKAHGATITVESLVGRGSTFRLMFPVMAGVLGSQGEAAPTPPMVGRSARVGAGRSILVIDDDDVVLLMLEGILMQAGFRVVAFSDPALALLALRADRKAVDIVVTDLNMPQFSGLDLVREVFAVWPQLPVVLSSGYVSDQLAAEASSAGAAAVFRKEAAAEGLVQLLCDVLDRAEVQQASVTPQVPGTAER